MSKLFTTRRRIAILVGASAMVLAGGGAAFAYFTSTGQGNGNATVGSATNWTVTGGTTATGTLLPCTVGVGNPAATSCTSDVQTITFTVTNTSTGSQQLSSWTPTIENAGTGTALVGGTTTTAPWIETGGSTSQPNGTYTGGSQVAGCQANWFTPTVTQVNGASPAAVDVPGGGTATVTVQVAMADSSTIDQDNCQGATPDVGLSVG